MPPRSQLQRPTETARADHFARLVKVRDRLDVELEKAPPAYVAGLARQLQSVLNELATLDDPDGPPSPLDGIRARREARLAGGQVQ